MSDIINSFVQVNNQIINTRNIKWVKYVNNCVKICTAEDGCKRNNTIESCKQDNIEEYKYLVKYFEKNKMK